ncbi:hypothetical protein VULLAG_LOCUS13233 [Vulpes lagopus]
MTEDPRFRPRPRPAAAALGERPARRSAGAASLSRRRRAGGAERCGGRGEARPTSFLAPPPPPEHGGLALRRTPERRDLGKREPRGRGVRGQSATRCLFPFTSCRSCSR